MQIKLDRDKRYLLACSYGPDSMALFSVLVRDKYMFAVAHVNYGLRGKESDLETGNLIQYCKDKNKECFVRKINGKNIKGNFQNAARKIRYEFFKEIAETHNFDVLLTAHHADDVIETYLMQ
jgi:tRNA(Ile)-lysidine synthase